MIRLYKYIFVITAFFCIVQPIAAYGLRFCGTDYPIDQRTSYHVFAHHRPCYKGYFDMEFNMALYPAVDIGYVVRVKGEGDQIFNLFFDLRGDDLLFRLNQEGENVLIALPVNVVSITKNHWFKVKIVFDLKNDEITLKVHDSEKTCKGVGLPGEFRPEIVFGRSDHIIDVPSIAIDKLAVRGAQAYEFPLDEMEGESVHDRAGVPYGKVENPVWLINEACHWRKEAGFASATEAGSCYDAERNVIYYFNSDSLFIYNMETGETSSKPLASRCPMKLFLASSFVDRSHEKIYVYEVFHEPPGEKGPAMVSLDLQTLDWKVEGNSHLSMQLHHHDACYDAKRQRYTIFGGFGNMLYSNKFYVLNTEEARWDTLGPLSGDVICPRYFSSVGYLTNSQSIYVFGGMGNESGEQIVGRRYFHDLYKVDLREMKVRKLWELAGEPNVVPARGMVIRDDSTFYVLRYPENVSHSRLHLYRFSIKDGSYQMLGDSIPILSDKITTNAHLYYNERRNSLFATVQETSDDVASTLTVYSLLFPPVPSDACVSRADGNCFSRMWIALAAVLVVVACVGLFVFRRYRKSRKNSGAVEEEEARREPVSVKQVARAEDPVDEFVRPNSVYLFGDFAVFDRDRRNISYLFSLRIKQVFCLILCYSGTEGISSKELGNWIWPDKSKDKVKNSRGVALNHLRTLLKELDGIELVYEKGCFRFMLSDGFYCDYLRCLDIVSANRVDESRHEFMRIIGRGKFISFMDDPLFDRFKQDVEYRLESLVLEEMEASFASGDYPAAVSLAEAEFNIDPVNEIALSCCIRSLFVLKRENTAIAVYQKFVTEYKKETGEEYPRSFRNYWR